MIIRRIEKKDDRDIARMIRAVFDEHGAPKNGTVYSDPATDDLYNLFRAPGSVFWVAEENKQIEGCCGIYPTRGLPEGCAELVKFYLPASARGKGIGKELMEKSINSAKQLGYKQLYIESLPQFSKAVTIYLKQGFVNLSAPLGNSGHTTCNIWMSKLL